MLATEEEISAAPGKQGVTNIRKISIRKSEEQIQINTYIQTFNQPYTLKEVKIGHCPKRVKKIYPGIPEVLQMSKI